MGETQRAPQRREIRLGRSGPAKRALARGHVALPGYPGGNNARSCRCKRAGVTTHVPPQESAGTTAQVRISRLTTPDARSMSPSGMPAECAGLPDPYRMWALKKGRTTRWPRSSSPLRSRDAASPTAGHGGRRRYWNGVALYATSEPPPTLTNRSNPPANRKEHRSAPHHAAQRGAHEQPPRSERPSQPCAPCRERHAMDSCVPG